MRKETITLNVARQQTMRVDAYLTEEPKGLAIHRAVVWVPAKNEHKFISKWTVTHVASGLTLLQPSNYLPTKKACVALTKELAWINWEGDTTQLRAHRKDVLDAIAGVKDGQVLPEDDVETETPRYIIRRARGVGYEVVDTATDTPIETYTHRGLASSSAKEKNARESL